MDKISVVIPVNNDITSFEEGVKKMVRYSEEV